MIITAVCVLFLMMMMMLVMLLLLLLMMMMAFDGGDGDDVYDYGVDGDDLGGCDNGNNDAAGDADDDEGVNGGGEDEGHRITYLPQQLQYWTTMKHGVLSLLGETSLNTHLNVSSYPLSRVPDCQYPAEEHP